MKPIISLIDFIMIHEGKKTLRYIEKESLKKRLPRFKQEPFY